MAVLHIAPELIVSAPDVADGTPCFAGTNVSVTTFFADLAEGKPLEDILQSHPTLTRGAATRALEAASHYLEFYARRATDSVDNISPEAACMTCEGRRHVLTGSDMLDAVQAADQLGISALEVNQRARSRTLLALPHPDAGHQLYYPEWQFASRVRPHVPDVLQLLHNPDPWACYRFFVECNSLLHDETPLEALTNGDVKAVLTVARIAADNEQ